MRHLVKAGERGLNTEPRVVAELGPGDSLGVGLAALLSGAEAYYAFDARPHSSTALNVKVFDDLVGLFEKRERIPGEDEFPNLHPVLGSPEFPSGILNAERIQQALAPDRIAALRAAVAGQQGPGGDRIRYFAPWDRTDTIARGSVDMALSQAVLEHVSDLPAVYRALQAWLRPGAFMSHTIDFKSHGLAPEWWGHWSIPEWQWKIVLGKRPYLLNREPLSVHLEAMVQTGFEIVSVEQWREAGPSRANLAPGFLNLTDDDLVTTSAFVQAKASR